MAAVIRRHWWSALGVLLLVAMGTGWILFAHRSLAVTPEGDAAAAPTVRNLDPATYTRVQRLREQLMLANSDLAAMGCSKETVGGALTALADWCVAQKAALDEAEQAVRVARRAVAAATERINVGPRDDQVIGQLPARQQDLEFAEQRRQQLLEGAVQAVAAHLSDAQNQLWSMARAQASLPARYRFVSGVTAQQAQAIKLTAAKFGPGSSQMRATEQQVLGISQRDSAAQVLSGVSQHVKDVAAAEKATLPVPTELKPRLAPVVSPVNGR